MTKATLILIAFLSALTAATGNSGRPHPGQSGERTTQRALTPQERAIKVAIATVWQFLRSAHGPLQSW